MEIQNLNDLRQKLAIAGDGNAVPSDQQQQHYLALLFLAAWHPPAQQMKAMLPLLVKDFPKVQFYFCDADVANDLLTSMKVSNLPTVVFFANGREVSRLSGSDPPAFVQRLKDLQDGKIPLPCTKPCNQPCTKPCNQPCTKPCNQPCAQSCSKENAKQEVAVGGTTADAKLQQRLKALINAAPVMIFMKGTRAQPFCKFSKAAMAILAKYDVEFGTFDIFQDEAVRQGLKELSNWPTYPQLYVNGEFIGGVDIMTEMDADGSLKEIFEKVGPKPDLLTERLKALTKQKPVMLFMKGTPQQPQCKFSKQMVDVLAMAGIEYGHFDILQDEEVRQGLKKMSNWPTYPQLYSGGNLIGGLDVISEIIETSGAEGLKAELQMAAPESK